jgi:beta-N-acetylhexosaminidase
MNDRDRRARATTQIFHWLIGFIAVIITAYLILVAVLIHSMNLPGGMRSLPTSAVADTDDEEERNIRDLSSWTDEELIAQMLIVMVPSNDTVGFYILAQHGIGAIAFNGLEPAEDMVEQLRYAQEEAHQGIKMLVASDEEGGEVSHLGMLLGSLPAPIEIAKLPLDEVRETTRRQGLILKDAGVHVVLAPALDLSYEGTYMSTYGRTFSSDPHEVAEVGIAWIAGMHDAEIAVAPKHWPGIGSAPDTHQNVFTTAPLSDLEKKDLIPFNVVLSQGIEMIMLGPVIVPGLTESDTPVTLSPRAYEYLRRGNVHELIVVTDALDMKGARESLSITRDQAAIRSVHAGADLVMISTVQVDSVIDALVDDLEEGILSRNQIEASVRRILLLKERFGLLPD